MQSQNSQERQESQPKFVVITFYTSGKPFKDLTSALQKFKQGLQDTDEFIPYSYEATSRTTWWKQNVKCYNDVQMQLCHINPHAELFGYWKWKPYLLLQTMLRQPKGTVILYHDVDCEKYPTYLNGLPKLKATCIKILDSAKEDIWIPYDNPHIYFNKHFCKPHAVRSLVKHPHTLPEFWEKPILLCNRILVRNTLKMQEWMSQILQIMHDEWLAPVPDPFPHPQKMWYSGDTSVWNIFMHNKLTDGELNDQWPNLYAESRDMSIIKSRVET
jgi:hypothetical protein